MNKGRLQVIDGENSESLSAFRLLLDGEMPPGPEFRKRFIDCAGDFLRQPEFEEFASLVFVPFDQLTDLVWRIKEEEIKELGGNPEDLLKGVEKVEMKRAEWEALVENLEDNYNLDFYGASKKDLLAVAISLLHSLQQRLNNLAMKYHAGPDDEEIIPMLIQPVAPLMFLGAINLWRQIGERLADLQKRLDSLRFSLQVYSSPVQVNHSMIETDNIFFFNACKSMAELLYLLENSDNLESRTFIRTALDNLKIYPFYHRQYAHGVKLILGNNLDFNSQPVSSVEKYLISLKKKVIQYFCYIAEKNLKPGLRGEFMEPANSDPDIITEEVDGSGFLNAKVIAVIRDLLEDRRVEEAEDLVRSYHLVNNQINFSEYNSRDDFFWRWHRQRRVIKRVLKTARKKQFKMP
jgi:hypothetical protein